MYSNVHNVIIISNFSVKQFADTLWLITLVNLKRRFCWIKLKCTYNLDFYSFLDGRYGYESYVIPTQKFFVFSHEHRFLIQNNYRFSVAIFTLFIPSQIVEFESNPKIAWKFGEVSDDKNKTFIGIEEHIIMLFRPLQF